VDEPLVEGVRGMSTVDRPQNPPLRHAIATDLAEMAKAKGTPYPSLGGLADVLSLPGTWATIVWRLAIACHHRGLKPLSRLLYFANIVVFGAELQPGVVVEAGIVIPHPVGIGVASGCTIGRRVRLMGGVRMGGNANPDRPGHPTLGDDVWILDGAKVFGPTTIGDRSIVGTSAIVSEDVPPDMFLFGARRSDTMRPLADLGLSDHGGSLADAVTVAADRVERDAADGDAGDGAVRLDAPNGHASSNGGKGRGGPLVMQRAGEG
jgi:serine O-acetyltransferase